METSNDTQNEYRKPNNLASKKGTDLFWETQSADLLVLLGL